MSGSAEGGRCEPWQLEFVERFATLSDVSGLPPSHLRVFAWLIVAEPPEQSVDDLRQVLGLSAGAISMATSTLARMGVVRKLSRPSQRRVLFRFDPDGWGRVLQLRLQATAYARSLAEEAMAAAGRQPERLVQMRDMYGFFERQIAELLAGRQTTKE